jgi:hypothetical protein
VRVLRAALWGRWIVVLVLACLASNTSRSESTGALHPCTIEFYYNVKLGHADEWLELYRRNHWPILVAERQAGYIERMEITRPQASWPEPYRWDVRISFTYRHLAVAHGQVDAGRAATVRRLFPDLAAHKRAELRRFELLDGQWDIELAPVATEAWSTSTSVSTP